jgi:hypothetical protein
MSDQPEDPRENGVCVACKAAGPLLTHQLSEGLIFEVCQECKDDGTYLKWLTGELEKAAADAGDVCTVMPDGRKLWSKPPAQ